MGWTTDWAPTSAELSACVECGLCLPHCPTFRLTGDEVASPRGRLNAMSAVASGAMSLDDAFTDVMSFCLQCRACEAACPSLVPFGRAMEGARAEVAAAGLGSGFRRRIVGSWIDSPRRVAVASFGAALAQRIGAWVAPRRLRSGLRGMRRIGFRRRTIRGHESDGGGETVGLLAGCVMDRWFPDVNEATVAVLEAAGYRVVVPDDQGCCGALAAHDGAAAEAGHMTARNAVAFGECDVVVANAAGCSAHLVGGDHWGAPGLAGKSTDVLRLVAAAIADGRLPSLTATGTRIGVQDPCHHRHAQRMTEEPRTILRAAGYEPVDVDPAGMCCGAAGVWSVSHPDESARLGANKAEEITRLGVVLVASANPGCEMQLRSHTNGVRIAHPIELYAEALGL
jgi:glycolate oxidase iron-sulfur subunit